MRYIGLLKEHLDIENTLSARISYREKAQPLTKKDVVSSVLMRIRIRISSIIIADMFGVGGSWVRRILSRYIPVIASCLQNLICWPPSAVIKKRLHMLSRHITTMYRPLSIALKFKLRSLQLPCYKVCHGHLAKNATL